jgi:hypothetical protein
MTYSQTCILAFSILLSSQAMSLQSAAEEFALPNYAGRDQVGRLLVFRSDKSVNWYAPLAFSADFRCFGGTDGKKACSLQIYNTATRTERASLARLETTVGTPVSFFTNLESFVTDISERFVDLPTNFQAPVSTPRTLTLKGEGIPYISHLLRIPSDQADAIELQFRQSGVGNFLVKFTLQAESIETLVGIRNTTPLTEYLRSLEKAPMSLSSATKGIHDAIEKGGIISIGLDKEVALHVLYWKIRGHFLQRVQSDLITAKADTIKEIPARMIVIDETVRPLTLRCTASLKLMPGSEVASHCELLDRNT